MEHSIQLNSLPAPTWNRMGINSAAAVWPSAAEGEPVLSSGQAPLAEGVSIPTGAGAEADGIFARCRIRQIEAAPGQGREELADFAAGAGESAAAVLRLIARAGSRLTVYTRIGSAPGGHAALRLLLEAEDGAALRLVELVTPGEGGAVLHDIGAAAGEGAEISVLHLYLGRGDLFSGCRADLAGAGAKLRFEAGYLEQGSQSLDVNLIANHFGPATESHLRADGTLKGQAKKTFRGTIDFRRGAKGAVGAETENVLLLGEDVQNKTVPLILCAEEDVQGDHGATIGELDEETLFYFASRGIGPREAENLLTREKLERLCAAIGREDMVSSARRAIEEALL